MPASIGFLGGFFLFLVCVVIGACWALALVDLIRRNDLSGWMTAFWIVIMILLPVIGVILYFIISASRDTGPRQPSDFYRKFK